MIRALVVLALLGGCKAKRSYRDAAPRPPPGAVRGAFALTYYWIADQPPDDKPTTTLYTKTCEPLATVSAAFATALDLAGTGKLLDNRVIGVAGECECKRTPCMRALPPEQTWGVGVDNRPLVPFVSVAVDRDVIPIGTHLYIAELDGVQLPTGAAHDGCVIADDTGGRIKGQLVDWFVGSRAHYTALDRIVKVTKLTVHDGGQRCR